MKPTTIYDVAREAGVSIASVSNAINGKGKIGKKKREEILKVMERLNYQPSVIASALTGKKTYTLGLLIPDVANPFFAEIARAVEDIAHSAGYSVITCSTDHQDERVLTYIRLLEQKSVDGILIGTGGGADILAQLAEKPLPTVTIAREVQGLPVSGVATDDFRGASLAAAHLLALGHRRMAVLAEDLKVSSSQERVRGFRFSLFEAGVRLEDEDILPCASSIEDGKRATLELLRRSDRPTALFCSNELLAVGALQAARDAGIAVPADLSVVGYDNTLLSTATNPLLTTVAQPIEQMVKMAFELLIGSGQESAGLVPQRIVMQPELVVRESTCGPKTAELV